jgi:16S rRNA processing protein RimM
MQDSELLNIGKIVAAHGLKGEVRVYPTSDFPERFEKKGTRWLLRPNQSEPETITLIRGSYMPGKNLYIIKIEGINHRDQAEELQGCELFVKASDRPTLAEGEYHVLDLVGLQVFDQKTGESLGFVVDLLAAGNDLLQIELTTGKKVLIPFVEAIVPVVDLSQKRIEINPPVGLLDL